LNKTGISGITLAFEITRKADVFIVSFTKNVGGTTCRDITLQSLYSEIIIKPVRRPGCPAGRQATGRPLLF